MRRAALLALALSACATSKPPPDAELRAQLKAMSERQFALERKLEALQARIVLGPKPAPAYAASGKETPASYEIPKHLTTVKLGPKAKAAPPVPTAVALREPEPDVAAEIIRSDEDEGAPPAGEGPDQELAVGMKAISTGDVEFGVRALIQFADRYPKHPEAAHALFSAGAGLQSSGDAHGASEAFTRVSDDYPLSEQAPEAMIRHAQCQLKLKKDQRAKDLLAQVITRYPGTPAARSAQAQLKDLGGGNKATQ